MRIHAVGRRPAKRLLLCTVGVVLLAGLVSGVLAWCWTQAALLLELRGRCGYRPRTRRTAMWHLLLHGRWSEPASAFPTRPERAAAPEAWAYVARRGLLPRLSGLGGLAPASPPTHLASRLTAR